MWYIYLKDSTSLSKETINLCIANNVHTLQNLFELYFSEQKFDQLKFLSENNKSELTKFCVSIMLFLEGRLEKRDEEINTQNETVQKAIVIENLTLNQLLNDGLISKRLFHALQFHDLVDFKSIYNHYDRHRTFLDLERIGNEKNAEAKRLLEKFILQDTEVEPSVGTLDQNKSTTLPNYSSESSSGVDWKTYMLSKANFVNFLDKQRQDISNWLYRYFIEAINEIEEDKFVGRIKRVYNNPQKYADAIGSSKSSDIRNFIIQSSKLSPSAEAPTSTVNQKLARQFEENKIIIGEEAIQELWVENKNPLKLMDIAFGHFNKMSFEEHIILQQVEAAKYFINDQRYTYEEVRMRLSEIKREELPKGTFKPWVMRAKEKFETFITSFCGIIDLKDFVQGIVEEKDGVILLRESVIYDLNEKFNVSFAKPVYNLLVKQYFPAYNSVYDLQKDVFENLYYFKADEDDSAKLKKTYQDLNQMMGKDSVAPRQWAILQNTGLTATLKTMLEIDQTEFSMQDNVFVFPPTRSRKPGKIESLIQILKENGEAMYYPDIVDEVNRKHPGLFTTYRAPKDALHVSEHTMSLGGRSDYYILTEWKDQYSVGGLKTIISDFLEQQNAPRHFYQVYEFVAKAMKHREPPIQAIQGTLAQLSDVFKHHPYGFYSLRLMNFDMNQGIPLNTSNHAFTDGIIHKPEDEITTELNRKYPGIHPDQIHYLIRKSQSRSNPL